MSIESGSISGQFLHVPRPLPPNIVERFAAHAMPPLETLGDGTIQGWVTGRHTLDRNITDETAFHGGFLRMRLSQVERKIPGELLIAECRIEELAHLQAQGVEKVSGSVRREIRRSVEDRLLPQAQPHIHSVQLIHDESTSRMITTAINDKQLDALQVHFAQAAGFSMVPETPDLAAMLRCKVNVRDWTPTSFSPQREDEEVSHDPGLDFLTWLWFVAEAKGGQVKVEDLGEIGIMIEGPLLMVMEGAGSHEALVRKGEPMLSAETKGALLSGKKLRRAKLTLARGDQAWTCTMDAVSFVFRGLKIPQGEKLDPISKFQERMDLLRTFHDAFFGLFDGFVSARSNGPLWHEECKQIHAWVANRRTR
jgi:hypothetical protein